MSYFSKISTASARKYTVKFALPVFILAVVQEVSESGPNLLEIISLSVIPLGAVFVSTLVLYEMVENQKGKLLTWICSSVAVFLTWLALTVSVDLFGDVLIDSFGYYAVTNQIGDGGSGWIIFPIMGLLFISTIVNAIILLRR